MSRYKIRIKQTEEEKQSSTKLQIYRDETERGFKILYFRDRYDEECSIQKSSLATEDAIWFGINSVNPEMFKPGEGFSPYQLPDNVHISTRMHLTQRQVRDLLPILIKFAETGDIDGNDDN